MPESLTYTFFLLPIALADIVIVILFSRKLRRYKKTLAATVFFFAVPWYFVVDILAVRVWRIWFYDTEKLLAIWLAGTTLEEFVWMILVAFLVASLTLVLAKD